jgi:hypothetical protein
VTELEKQEQFMLLLLSLATRRERQIVQDNRVLFTDVMRKLRRLVQRMSPEGAFRQYEWRRLQREAPQIINELVVGFTETLMPELVALEEPVQEFAQDYADLDELSFVPQTEQQLLNNIFIEKLPLILFLTYNGRLTKSLFEDFNRVVNTGLLRGETTQQIADKVLKLTMRKGKVVPVVKTGSFANKASTQIKNTLDNAVWGTINNNLNIGWRDVAPTYWVWNAVLDGKTCPVCVPLNGKRVPRPPAFVSTGYSRTLPPVHPNCRCVILPVFT